MLTELKEMHRKICLMIKEFHNKKMNDYILLQTLESIRSKLELQILMMEEL